MKLKLIAYTRGQISPNKTRDLQIIEAEHETAKNEIIRIFAHTKYDAIVSSWAGNLYLIELNLDTTNRRNVRDENDIEYTKVIIEGHPYSQHLSTHDTSLM